MKVNAKNALRQATMAVASAVFVSCGGSPGPSVVSPPLHVANLHQYAPQSASGYQLLYSFRGSSNSQSDGDYPHSSLVAVKDQLYGTTVKGGSLDFSSCGHGKFFAGCGTVFEIDLSGKEHVAYRFTGGRDGFFPYAGLLALNGTLYGTTMDGGAKPCKRHGSCGTVF